MVVVSYPQERWKKSHFCQVPCADVACGRGTNRCPFTAASPFSIWFRIMMKQVDYEEFMERQYKRLQEKDKFISLDED